MEPLHRGRLAAELELDEENDVFEVSGMLAIRDAGAILLLQHHYVSFSTSTERSLGEAANDP